jgi:hypothetical protein
MDVDFIIHVENYDENVRVRKATNRGDLIRFDKEFIFEVFSLKLASNKVIYFDMFKKKYQQDRNSFRMHWLHRYRLKVLIEYLSKSL